MDKITIYGWNENTYNLDLIARQIDPTCITFDVDGAVLTGAPEGYWFRNFQAAKKAAIKYIQDDIELFRETIRTLRATKKADI